MASPGKSKRFAGQMPMPRGEAGACSSRAFEGAAFSRAAMPLPEAHHRDCSRRGDVRRCRCLSDGR